MPPVPEAEEERIRALPRKELQALAKELGVKANGKTVTILDDVLAALNSQASSAEASPSEQQPGDAGHSTVPAQVIDGQADDPDSHEQASAVCQQNQPVFASEPAHPDSEQPIFTSSPLATAGKDLPAASVDRQNAAAYQPDPASETVNVSSNPIFEPANAVPSDAAADAVLTDPLNSTAPVQPELAAAELAAEPNAEAQLAAAEPLPLPSSNVVQAATSNSPYAVPMAAEPATIPVEAAAPQQDGHNTDSLAEAVMNETAVQLDDGSRAAAEPVPIQLDPQRAEGMPVDMAVTDLDSLPASSASCFQQGGVEAQAPGHDTAGGMVTGTDELSMAAMETDAALDAIAAQTAAEPSAAPAQLQSAKKAFVKGRESGIWQGAKQVQLQDLESQWDSYKAGTKRGLELPNLADVHQRSVALAESGFTTADSPNIRASTRSAIHLPAAGSKRKAGDIDEGSADKPAPDLTQQPPAKRQTPAKRAAWNSPCRPMRTAVPRVPSASALQPRDNVEASLTPSGRKILHAKRTLSLKDSSLTEKPVEASARDMQQGASRKAAPPKPSSHVDRAKKAAEVFTARRAAALAKARE